MNTETLLTDEQLVSQAVELLIEKLGITETTRFLALKRHQRLDSVTRHQQWQTTLERDKFFDQVFGKS